MGDEEKDAQKEKAHVQGAGAGAVLFALGCHHDDACKHEAGEARPTEDVGDDRCSRRIYHRRRAVDDSTDNHDQGGDDVVFGAPGFASVLPGFDELNEDDNCGDECDQGRYNLDNQDKNHGASFLFAFACRVDWSASERAQSSQKLPEAIFLRAADIIRHKISIIT